MAIGIDDVDFIDEDFENGGLTPQNTGNDPVDTPDPDSSDDQGGVSGDQEEDFLASLLKSRGIEDMAKIRFENEDGDEEEVSWESLSNEDKLNIINSTAGNPETDLDDSEILLINAIRSSNMTPAEYIQYVEQSGVERYVQNNSQVTYSTDQYTDDELFVMDFIARMGDVTNEEAEEALERAKTNETLFAKQMGAIRKEYQKQEDELNRQAQFEQEQQAQEQYNQFTGQVVDEINNFTEFSGYDLNLENDDMQELYDFITGVDAAGNNHFAKALADPKTLVRTAYLALNGQLMINDITDYFQKEISLVRKESYKKGKEDAQKLMNKPDVVFKNKQNKVADPVEVWDDLD